MTKKSHQFKIIYFVLINIILNIMINYLLGKLIYRYLNNLVITIIIIAIPLILALILNIMMVNNMFFKEAVLIDPNDSVVNPILEKYLKLGYKLPNKFKVMLFEKNDFIPSPAFASLLENKIYVADLNALGIHGIIAHELGHVESRLAKFLGLRLFRPNVLFANFLISWIRLGVVHLNNMKKSILKSLLLIVWILIILIYLITMVTELLLIVPLVRSDERLADQMAIKLGYGHDLKLVLFKYIRNDYKLSSFSYRLLRLLDLDHPDSRKRIEIINQSLGLTPIEQEFYHAQGELYFCTLKALKIVIPDYITSFKDKAFNELPVTDLDLNMITTIPYRGITNLANLKTIRFLKGKSIGSYGLANNPMLETVIAPDLKVIEINAFQRSNLLDYQSLYLNTYVGKYYLVDQDLTKGQNLENKDLENLENLDSLDSLDYSYLIIDRNNLVTIKISIDQVEMTIYYQYQINNLGFNFSFLKIDPLPAQVVPLFDYKTIKIKIIKERINLSWGKRSLNYQRYQNK